MRKILALLALVAALAVAGGVSTPNAQAAAGCGTHQVSITDWSENGQMSWTDQSFDFQCGGTTSNWRIVFHLQADTPSGWVDHACGGAVCTVYRPGPSSFYTSGTEHGCLNAGCGPDWTWNPGPIGNTYFRVQAIVHFANGDPNLTYYSAERKL